MVLYFSDHDQGVYWQLNLLDSCDVCTAAKLGSHIATVVLHLC